MKLYLSHNFAARPLLRQYARNEFARFEIVSDWIWLTESMNDSFHAKKDRDDIDRCDVFVFFLDQFGKTASRWKFWEWGYAVAKGKTVILIGDDTSCIFYHLDNLLKFDDVTRAVIALEGMADIE